MYYKNAENYAVHRKKTPLILFSDYKNKYVEKSHNKESNNISIYT